jgi:hypothetical protein
MKRSLSLVSCLLVSGALALPAGISPALALGSGPEAASLIARGSGGRIGGGGGGGGGRKASRPAGGSTGFKNAGAGLNSGAKKPTGGWSSKAKSSGGPSLDRAKGADRQLQANRERSVGSGSSLRSGERQAVRSDRIDSRSDVRSSRIDQRSDLRSDRMGNRTDRIDARSDVRRDRIDARTDRMDRRWDSFDNRWDNYPGWARPGWGYARPWNYGWYGGWATPAWGWWGARAAAWGVGALATAAIINDAVDDAVSDHVSYIAVPNSNYGLLYGTVAPSGSDGVTFEVIADGAAITMSADCRRGTLNGRDPNTVAEAELLNAACQVAYGAV